MVAPHAGARIETGMRPSGDAMMLSLPMRERELKRHVSRRRARVCRSLPMRERELKLTSAASDSAASWSLPMRERELKPCSVFLRRSPPNVAPHAGARIETQPRTGYSQPRRSLPMRERELKLVAADDAPPDFTSLPMRERELKPSTIARHLKNKMSLPMRERELKLHNR